MCMRKKGGKKECIGKVQKLGERAEEWRGREGRRSEGRNSEFLVEEEQNKGRQGTVLAFVRLFICEPFGPSSAHNPLTCPLLAHNKKKV